MSSTSGWIGKDVHVTNNGQLYTNTAKPVTKVKVSDNSPSTYRGKIIDM